MSLVSMTSFHNVTCFSAIMSFIYKLSHKTIPKQETQQFKQEFKPEPPTQPGQGQAGPVPIGQVQVQGGPQAQGGQQTNSSGQPVEFNHAISYVNKIKVCLVFVHIFQYFLLINKVSTLLMSWRWLTSLFIFDKTVPLNLKKSVLIDSTFITYLQQRLIKIM